MGERSTAAGADTMTRELHDLDPKHDMCLGDDPCVCRQLEECETLAVRRGYEMGIDAARAVIDALKKTP